MTTISIYPDKLQSFPGGNENFFVIITPSLVDHIKLFPSKKYKNVNVIVCEEVFSEWVADKIPPQSDMFFIPYQYTKLFKPPKTLPHNQRLIWMICKPSTPMSVERIRDLVELIYKTDLQQLKDNCDRVFNALEGANQLQFINEKHGTKATLKLDSSCTFTEIIAELKAGEIGAVPSGEISLNHSNFRDPPPINRLKFDGTLIFKGMPILHNKEIEFFADPKKTEEILNDQKTIFEQLFSLNYGELSLSFKDGDIVSVDSLTPSADPAKEALETLFARDANYRVLIEIGLGLNQNVELINANSHANEMYGGKHFCVHFGFGVGLHKMRYHFDVLCPDTTILTNTNKLVLGPPLLKTLVTC